ncbi:MAG: hypothetical protein Q9227_008819 [Pyrenula ochraceoflavens]
MASQNDYEDKIKTYETQASKQNVQHPLQALVDVEDDTLTQDNGESDPTAVPLGSRKALWAYLILCFSDLQITPVRYPDGELCVTSLADKLSGYRKVMLMVSIFLFGALALPFAGLKHKDYSTLTALSVLYCFLTTVQGVYQVIEASYIPIFMRSAGWFRSPRRLQVMENEPVAIRSEPESKTWRKGFNVSVLGLVASNVGGLVALLIGIILIYGKGSYVKVGYEPYLLAITIGGCITIIFAVIGQMLLPNIAGHPKPKGQNILLLPAKGWYRTLLSVPRYPQAFKLCIAWVLWNTGYTNYLGLIQSLFLEVTGLNTSSGIYQVWSFTSVILACLGSLSFLLLYPYLMYRVPIKSWAYTFLLFNTLCVLWGCIGISQSVTIGYKHAAEFWIQQVLFMTTSSALRAYNRALYGSLVPRGAEAQFFGLEITLDLATGWINPLVQGVIQGRTHNLRYPMLPNLFLIVIAAGLYWWVDVEAGIEDAKTAFHDEQK